MKPVEESALSPRAEPCPHCDAPVLVAPGAGAYLRCEHCGMRFSRPRPRRADTAWQVREQDGLGIHPALAKRYRPASAEEDERENGAPKLMLPSGVQLSPSLVGEAAAGARDASEFLADPADEQAKPKAHGHVSTLPGPLAITEPSRARVARAAQETPLARKGRNRPAPAAEGYPDLPDFEILAQVGQGAMGRVFQARERSSGQVAAVKVLAPELAARADFVARFEREAAAMARVHHRGVVRIVGNRASGGWHYLWMEFVEGGSLRRILDQGPLSPSRALAFARQILQGLGAAHDVGVIHRDLKPENILVEPTHGPDAEERLVLVDFGLAGIEDENEDPHPNLTKSRMTMGTVNYMAPEQRTNAKHVDQRADLYATGVILYELLLGDLPLGRFALPTERGLPLPRGIDDIVIKALARLPDERYQRASDFDRALAEIEVEVGFAASLDTLVGERKRLAESEEVTAPSSRARQATEVDDARVTPLPPSRGAPGAGAANPEPSNAGTPSAGTPSAGNPSSGPANPGVPTREAPAPGAVNPGAVNPGAVNPGAVNPGSLGQVPEAQRPEGRDGTDQEPDALVEAAVGGTVALAQPAAHRLDDRGGPAPRSDLAPSAPGWHRFVRPELALGALALVVGALAGLLAAPGNEGSGKFRVEAPAPQPLPSEGGVATAALDLTAPAALWRSDERGFFVDGGEIAFTPAADHSGLAVLRAPERLEGDFVEVRGTVHQPIGDAGWGALLLADDGKGKAIGAALRTDGACGLLLVDGRQARFERLPCQVKAGRVQVAVRCATSEPRCSMAIDGRTTSGITAPTTGLQRMALACEGASCRFSGP